MPGSRDSSNEISDGLFLGPVIQARDLGSVTLRLPAEVPAALSGLPPGSATFSGRDGDLELLLDSLDTSSTVAVAAVGGMGGIGKTELAVQAARTAVRRGRFAGGVLFVDMFGYDPERRLAPEQALEGLLRAVGVPGEHIPAEVQDRSRLFRSVLTAYAREGRRVLVVIDNVSASDQARPLLPADGAAIVTSRERLADLDARLIDLDTLATEDAVDLLDRALVLRDPADTRVTSHPDDARRLAGLCGGLPLALKIVSALLAENTAKPLAVMATELADTATRLEEMRYAGRAVRALFDLSYDRLAKSHARLFRLLSLNPGPDISTLAATALTRSSATEARHGLETLARAHLIEPGTVYGRWRMHDLIRLHSAHHGLANARPDRRDRAWIELLDHYLATTGAASAHLDARVADPASYGFADRRQALEWLDAEYPNLTAATYAAAAGGQWEQARDLPAAMWDFLQLRRHFSTWITLTNTALEATRTLGDPRGEADALTTLGGVRQELRRFDEAITADEAAAEIYRDLGERRGAAGVLTNLGVVLRDMRRFDEAIAAHRDAVAAFRELGERHGEASALDNLGVALRGTRRFEEAVLAHREAVAICRELADRHGEALAANNLGTALRRLERYEEAIAAHRDAIAIFRDVEDLHGEARASNNLGGALREVRRFEESIAMHRAAATIFGDLDDRYREGTALDGLEAARQAQDR